MKIEVKRAQDCPPRTFDGSVYTCSVETGREIVCDDDFLDDFPFPDGCPLKRDGTITIVKVKE